MPAKSGRMVHEQTASTVPATEATPYARALPARAPRYFITDAWPTKTEMAPAMRGEPTGRATTARKPPTSRISHFHSRVQSIDRRSPRREFCHFGIYRNDVPESRAGRTREPAGRAGAGERGGDAR